MFDDDIIKYEELTPELEKALEEDGIDIDAILAIEEFLLDGEECFLG